MKKISTKELIGIQELTDYSIKTKDGELVYFIIKPVNLSVLSDSSIQIKVRALMEVIIGYAEIELLCINSKETFDANKANMASRMEQEQNPNIRKLLQQDSISLDRMQVTMATAREFLLVIRLTKEQEQDVIHYLVQIETNLKDQGFIAKRANKDDLKRMLSVYFEQNVTTEQFEDVDGERWIL